MCEGTMGSGGGGTGSFLMGRGVRVLVVFLQTAVGRHLGGAFETLGPRWVGGFLSSEGLGLKRVRSQSSEEMRQLTGGGQKDGRSPC